jgi:DNA-binding CsgD family transcriptional regulator
VNRAPRLDLAYCSRCWVEGGQVSGEGGGDFLDFVYDAALTPGLWPLVIERLADMVGGRGGVLAYQNAETGRGDAVIVGADPSVLTPYFGYYASRNVLLHTPDVRGFMRTWTPRILIDEDWLPKEELVRSEYYNDFLRPIDVHSVLMVRLAAQGMNAVNLNIGRPERLGQFSSGDIDLMTQIHPHLIRSYKLGRRISAERHIDAGAAEFLDRSPHAVFLVGLDGRVRHANSAGEALAAAGDGISLIRGRLGAVSAEATRRLRALIGDAASPDAERRTGGSMVIETPERRLPLSVIVAPVRADRLAIFQGEPSIIVCITDPEAGVSLPEQRVRDLFGLSAAEARVALALVEGGGPRDAAEKLGVSFYTVRAHLVRIYDKTGTTRQSELVALILKTVGVMIR